MIRSRNKTIYLKDRRNRLRRGKNPKIVWAIIIGIGVLLGAMFAFWPNAYQANIDGVVIGALEEKEFIDNATETVTAQLKNKYNTEVKLEGEITSKKVRAGKKDMITPNYLATYMRENMDFLLEFQELSIDGKKVGIIESEQVLDELLVRLTEKYIGKTDQKVEFANQVELKPVFAKEKDLISIDALVDKCTQTTQETIEYEVVPGDSLSAISSKLGITIAKLISANEGMTETTVLKLGSKLKAEVDVPLLDVKVIEEPVVEEPRAENQGTPKKEEAPKKEN